ncbi:MAG: dihydrolipoyl dehydrogenase [Planctomycetes bacterium]|nr:dihydrolipoyl dehydrogenase [Planctomycetota bacterium]
MESFDLTVLGSGPGGYVAAIRASQLGMRTAVVERDRLGGVCLNWGCIPTKALLKLAEEHEVLKDAASRGFVVSEVGVDWGKLIRRSREAAEKLSRGVSALMKKNKVSVVSGSGRFLTPNRLSVRGAGGKTTEISTKHMVIATGARAASIPGAEIDGKRVISYREAMVLPERPRSLTVIGAGAIGLEFAYFYSAFGAEVTIVEYLDRILPSGDDEVCAALARAFKRRGMKVHTSSRVESVTATATGTRTAFVKDGKAEAVDSEVTLVAVGVKANVEDLGLEGIGVALERGAIRVDDHLRTSVGSVYAIGDVCGPPALAHVASAEGIHAVEHIAGKAPEPIDYSCIPACIYCHPQVAQVGLTEREAREAGRDVLVGRFPFSANGKSVAVGDGEGFVKIVGDARHGEILGAHIVGSEATELIGEVALAKAAELTVHDIHRAVHAHPTLSEALMEACADWAGEAIGI